MIESFASAAEFEPAVRPVVERFPAESSVLASLVVAGARGRAFDDAVWLLIKDGENPVGAAIHIAPHHLVLTPFDVSDVEPVAAALVSTLLDLGRRPAGVTGTLDVVWPVALAWERATGVTPRLSMPERLYEMSAPPAVPFVPGAARLATEADLPVLVRFFDAFDAEAEVNPGAEPAEPRIRRRLEFGALVLWERDGEAVSLAGLTNPVAGVSRVAPVFTPRGFRGHGYGSAVTAAATSLGFERGAHRVVLYTDLANPTSNKIYRALGYRPVTDAATISFRSLT